MNSLKGAYNLLYSKISGLLPNTPVFNGVAPESASMPLICFYVTSCEPTKFVSNLTAWEDAQALVHIWGNSYQYDKADTIIAGLDGLQGEAIGSEGSLLSARYLGTEPLESDADVNGEKVYGLVLKFNLRII